MATRRKRKPLVPPITLTLSTAPDPSIDDSLLIFSHLLQPDKNLLQVNPDKSSPSTSYAEIASSAANVAPTIVAGDNSSVPSSNPCPLKAIPSPKLLFVSRLTPDTTVSDLVDYLNSGFGGIARFKAEACRKISRLDSNFSSFKVIIPSRVFNTFLNKSFWPADSIVKEFTPFYTKNERASPLVNSQLNRNPKN